MQQAQAVNSFTGRGQALEDVASSSQAQPPYISRFSVHALIPPSTDSRAILQRADETSAVLRMLAEAQTSTVVLTGDAGAGKSILAALVFRHVQPGASPFQRFAWLSLGPNATLPDCLATLVSGLNAGTLPSDFFLLKPDQQITLFLQALRSPQASAFVVLDQFEELLDAGAINRAPTVDGGRGLPGRGAIALFLEMLQQDLGNSRVLLTSYRSPYSSQNNEGTRVRAYLVSRISLPEGVALLQQRGVQGSPQELSLVWQRCAGHAYALVLFSALFMLSGFSLSYLLNAPDYQFMWNGDVTLNLVSLVYNFLNPIQRTLLRALCLFSEPTPLEGILAAITGDGPTIDAQAFERELAALTRMSLTQQMPPVGTRFIMPNKPHYLLHTCIRRYTSAHYLEGSERRPNGNLISAVGVAFQPNPMAGNPEAREIALAAGHMRVTIYYFSQVLQFCPSPGQRRHMQDVEPLLALISHLCLGWHWQQACDLFFSEGLHDSLVSWGAWNTLIRLYTAMIPPAGIVTRRDEALICSHLGLLYGRLRDQAQSAHYYAQALDTQREIADLHGQAITLINQGEIFRSAGEKRQAHANFEEALLLLKQQPEARLEGVLLNNMGLLAQEEKDYNVALKYYLEALKLARSFQEQYNQGMILTNLGMLFFEQGRLREALALLLSALQVRRAVQDPTVNTLVLFLETLEQKMGPGVLAQSIQESQGKQGRMLTEYEKMNGTNGRNGWIE